MSTSLPSNDPNLVAGVAYYGMQAKAADVPKIKAMLMLHYRASTSASMPASPIMRRR